MASKSIRTAPLPQKPQGFIVPNLDPQQAPKAYSSHDQFVFGAKTFAIIGLVILAIWVLDHLVKSI